MISKRMILPASIFLLLGMPFISNSRAGDSRLSKIIKVLTPPIIVPKLGNGIKVKRLPLPVPDASTILPEVHVVKPPTPKVHVVKPPSPKVHVVTTPPPVVVTHVSVVSARPQTPCRPRPEPRPLVRYEVRNEGPAPYFCRWQPPRAIRECPGYRPSRSHFWRAGYWYFNHGRWTWIKGRWVIPPAMNARWVPGQWERIHDGWLWRPGCWIIRRYY
ncbi:MAG: hypothetical protein D6820_08490 [Lentisphaerae bacterium]|nr:MAG: hypothetical protein D6820_08490 [Lentisphaerota bacterium]